jgi:LacI family transcriptional regulator
MRVTQQQVAELAGVTRATVGYVLTGRRRGGKISDEVCARVREAARTLGYAPNRQAQALVSGRTRTIGLIVQGLSADLWVWGRIAEGAETALMRADHDVLLRAVPSGESVREEAGRLVREGRADGVIALLFSRLAPGGPARKRKDRFPLVSIDLGAGQPPPTVGQDPQPGLESAVGHLAEHGHRRIAWLTPGLGEGAPSANRAEAVRAAAESREMGVRTIRLPVARQAVSGRYEHNQPAVLEGIRGSVPEELEETGILCWNDFLAFCLCAVLRERGLRVPEDVSVIGFDDMRPMLHVPPLSTVSGAFSQMGEAAAELVLRLAGGDGAGGGRGEVAVPTFFVPRGSSGPAPGRRGRTRRKRRGGKRQVTGGSG